jgi:hypothetical protein
LRRLLALTSVPAEVLADALFPSPERLQEMLREIGLAEFDLDPSRIRPVVSIAGIVAAKQYLEKLAFCLGKKMQCKCAECGGDMWAKMTNRLLLEVRQVRRDARYCSQACRQKAFRKRKRKRVTANASNTKVKASRVTAISPRRSA